MPRTSSAFHGDDIEESGEEDTPQPVKRHGHTYCDDPVLDKNLLPNNQPAENATKINVPAKNNIPSYGFEPRDNLHSYTSSRKRLVNERSSKRKRGLDNAVASEPFSRRAQKTLKSSPQESRQLILSDDDNKMLEKSDDSKDKEAFLGDQTKAVRSKYFLSQPKSVLGSTLSKPAATNGDIASKHNICSQRTYDTPTEKLPVNTHSNSKTTTQAHLTDDSDDDLVVVGRPKNLTHQAPHRADDITATEWILTRNRPTKFQSPPHRGKKAAPKSVDSTIPLYLEEFRRGYTLLRKGPSKRDLVLTVSSDGEFRLSHCNPEVGELGFKKSDIGQLNVSESRHEFAINLKNKGPRQNDKPKFNMVYFLTDDAPHESHITEIFSDVKFEVQRDKYFYNFTNSMGSPRSHDIPMETCSLARRITRSTNYCEERRRVFHTRSSVPIKRPTVEISQEEYYGRLTKTLKESKRPPRLTTASTSGTTQLWIEELTSDIPSWKTPLIYPPTGKSRATVDYIDLDRLNDGEFLNDNIINFYLKWLEVCLMKEQPELAKKCHFFNTFFFGNLSRRTADRKRDFTRVMKWTTGVDLFTKQFIFVPINENTHWYLAIICNLQHIEKMVEQVQVREASNDVKFKSDDKRERAGEGIGGDSPIGVQIELSPKLNTEGESLREPQIQEIQEAQLRLTDDAEASLERMSIDENQPSAEFGNGEGFQPDTSAISKPGFDPGQCLEIDSDNSSPVKSSNVKAYTQKAERASKAHEPDIPAIFILDSLGTRGHQSTFKVLREYLREEAKNKKQIDIPAKATIGRYPNVPVQPNFWDCGLYLLYYVQKFLERPVEFTREFSRKEEENVHFDDTDIQRMRSNLKRLIIRLKGEQNKAELLAAEKQTIEENSEDDSIEIVETKTAKKEPSIEGAEEERVLLIEPMQIDREILSPKAPQTAVAEPAVVRDNFVEVTDLELAQDLDLEGSNQKELQRRTRSPLGSRLLTQLNPNKANKRSYTRPASRTRAVNPTLEVPDSRSPSPKMQSDPESQKKVSAPAHNVHGIEISDDDPVSIPQVLPSHPHIKKEGVISGVKGRLASTLIKPIEEVQDSQLQDIIRQDVQNEQRQQHNLAEKPRSFLPKNKSRVQESTDIFPPSSPEMPQMSSARQKDSGPSPSRTEQTPKPSSLFDVWDQRDS